MTRAASSTTSSPAVRRRPRSPPLNSDTATSLRLDLAAGGASNDIAALIIAPRGALDTRNADGDDYYYSGNSGTPTTTMSSSR